MLTAYVRLSTKAGLFPAPLSVQEALRQVHRWLDAPGAVVADPGPAHLTVLGGLLTRAGTGGNLVNDAHLAAVALEHRADVVTCDSDVTRFSELRCDRPDDLLGTGDRSGT